MQDQYISSGQGFLLVYSCTSLQSFQSISELREKILQVKDCETYPMVLCGNKCDLEAERKVSTQQGKGKCFCSRYCIIIGSLSVFESSWACRCKSVPNWVLPAILISLDLSKAWDVPFFETSAKTRLNVEEGSF